MNGGVLIPHQVPLTRAAAGPTRSVVRRRNLRLAALVCGYLACLYPVTSGDLSVNYTFVLLPVLHGIARGALQRPPIGILFWMGLFTAIFLTAFAYQLEFLELGARRAASFLTFMTIFALTVVRIDAVMIRGFKLAIVIVSLAFSLVSVVVMVGAGPNIGYEAKNLVGSQRYGFIYLMALWIVYLSKPATRTMRLAKPAALLTIVGGLLLTFSRASIAGLLASLAGFALRGVAAWVRRPSLRGVRVLVFSSAAAIAIVLVLRAFVPVTFVFFQDRFFNVVSNPDTVAAQLSDPDMSVGTRVVLLGAIVDYVLRNPLTGSGYLGIWALPGSPGGSAHNQYGDVLLRIGFLGFAGYMYLLCRVMIVLYREHQDLFWGMVGLLVYGVFHETFKESQGGFVLAFLFGMLAQSIRDRRRRLVALGRHTR